MNEILRTLMQHGYWVVFGVAFLEQAGLPIPALPVLLAAGALARTGDFSLTSAILMAMFGALAADVSWYGLGRRRGHFLLGWVCRLSLAPDSCVQWTKALFLKYGSPILLVGKFVPGFGATSVPLAGMVRMKLAYFLIFDGAGAALWAGTYIITGYLFSTQLARMAAGISNLGAGLTFWILFITAALLAWRYKRRRQPTTLQKPEALHSGDL